MNPVLARGAARLVGHIPPHTVRRLPGAQLLLNRALKRCPRAYRQSRTVVGFHVDGHTSDLIQRYLHVFGMWEPHLTHWLIAHLRPGDVVVDIGANIGYFSLLAGSRIGPTGQVHAFEPVPSIAAALEHNVATNGLPVQVHRLAVGDQVGEIEVFRSTESNLGRSGTDPSGGVSEGRVPVVPASVALPVEVWPRIRFIKVDVEGDERRVLRGLQPVLAALPDGAAVFVEVTPADLAARGENAAELFASMRALGFSPMQVPNSYAPRDYAHYRASALTPLHDVPTSQVDVLFLKESA